MTFLAAIFEDDKKNAEYYAQLSNDDNLLREIRLIMNSKYTNIKEMLKAIERKVDDQVDREEFDKFLIKVIPENHYSKI